MLSLVKKQKANVIFLQFGFSLALFSLSMATSLTETGCGSEYKRLIVDFSGDICGNVYDINTVGKSAVPKITFSLANSDKKYTVVMIDPDAPSNSNPKFRSWLHYLAVNVQGDDIKSEVSLGALSSSVEYNPPSPPSGSGLHRYMIYVMEQSGSVIPGSFPTRASFNIDAFVKKHDLKPVAFNMFKTENE